MKNPLEQLTSLERRFVVGVGVVLFIVLNLLFVWPQFKQWQVVKNRISKADKKLEEYQTMLAEVPELQKNVAEMESSGTGVPPEDQANQFLRIIQNTAAETGVRIDTSQPQRAPTNEFFLEQIQSISLTAGEKELVDFLYRLSEGQSLIRTRDIGLRRDPTGQKLVANIKLVASYQLKPATRPARGATTKGKTTPQPADSKSSTAKAKKS